MELDELLDLQELWVEDGAFRDLRISDASEATWESFVTYVRRAPHEYSEGDEKRALPSTAELRAPFDGSRRLRVAVGAATADGFFNDPDAIELTIDPHELSNVEIRARMLRFIENLARAVSTTVWLTVENCPHLPIASFDPVRATWSAYV